MTYSDSTRNKESNDINKELTLKNDLSISQFQPAQALGSDNTALGLALIYMHNPYIFPNGEECERHFLS